MAYFPNQIMPKMLMKETSKEVDDSPAIENAKDWNVQHREIRAIEKLLIGDNPSGGLVLAGSDQQGTTQLPKCLKDGVDYVRYLLEELFNGCWLSQYSGTVRYKNYIKFPDCVIQTKTTGAILSGDTTITVESTDGFPRSGTITKINGLRTEEYCQSGAGGSPVGGGDVCTTGTKYITYSDFFTGTKHRTSQEIITYTDKTQTQFLNCTRSVNLSTAEDLASDEQAVILSGNASLCISHNFWAEKANTTPHACEAYVSVTPDLYVDGGVLRRGTNQVTNSVEEFVEVSYTLTLISDFQDISLSDQITGGGGHISFSHFAGPVPPTPSPSPIHPPSDIKSGFFRLDTMSVYGLRWWGWYLPWGSSSSSMTNYWYQNNGLAVMPLSWFNETTKTVSYTVDHPIGSQYGMLNGSNTIPLTADIHPTYARFYASNPDYGPYSNINRIELIFKNYRTYGSLTVANVSFTISLTFLKNSKIAYDGSNWRMMFANVIASLSINGSSNLNAKSHFSFPVNGVAGFPQTNLLLNASNVSYIVPNKSISGWENYFNI